MRGAIVASLDTKYGNGAVDRFANEVGVTSKTLWQYRQVYTFYQNSLRSENLSFTHHLVSIYAPDAEVALKLARPATRRLCLCIGFASARSIAG